MTPDQLAAILSLFALVRDGGPWFIVFLLAAGLGWSLNSGRLVLKREYDRALEQLAAEEKETQFWLNKYFSVAGMADRAIEVASTKQRT